MWSCVAEPTSCPWLPNHFVPLVAVKTTPAAVIVVNDSSTEAPLAGGGNDTDGQDQQNTNTMTSKNNTAITDASLLSESSRSEVRGTSAGTHFLSNANIMRLLTTDVAGWDGISNGVKENSYFVINNCKTYPGVPITNTAHLRTTVEPGTSTSTTHDAITYIGHLCGTYGKFQSGAFVQHDPKPTE